LSFASLERTLDRTIESLMKGESSSESRGLLIEARRLRSVVANWRSIPPPADVYDEMLERVLHLSTSAGASIYEPTPDSLRTEFDPVLRTDYDSRSRSDFEHNPHTEHDPGLGAAMHASSRAAPSRDDEEPTVVQQDYAAAARVAAAPNASRAPVEAPPKRRLEASPENNAPTVRNDVSRILAQEIAPPPPVRAALGSSVGQRSAEPLRASASASASPLARGRGMTARAPMISESAPRVPQISDDSPSYPSFNSPAYPDDEAPSYPAYSLNEPTKHLPTEAIKARYTAEAQAPRARSHTPPARALSPPPQRRAPSYPPARATSDPALVRPAHPAPTTGDRLRAQSAPEMALDTAPVADDAPIAPATSVTVHTVQLGEKLDPHLVMITDAYSDRADAYRAIRRKLASSGNPQVIAITSPGVGEGKTTCALNLALAMRETSRGKVLLVEANGRSPSLAKLLGFETPECFGDQLLRHREDPRQPWVAVEPMPKLHIMAMDPKLKRAPQLDPLAFSNGMERLKRAGYEYILLDTPPVLGTFEVNMIVDNADGVLFTAITMKSKRSQLRKAIEQIMPAPILGVMVLDS
jgi:Mrp family chromosome partitioning ATPase